MTNMITDQEDPADVLSQVEMRKTLLQKAKDLFALCDAEGKGFATKRDMRRLQEELHLTPDQLNEVFDALDKDRNDCLTLDEFTDGFGMYLGIDAQSDSNPSVEDRNLEAVGRFPTLAIDAAEADAESEQFEDFLDQLGAQNVFKDEDYIRQMWNLVKNDDPAILDNFMDFLEKITSELKNSKKENSSLESILKNRSSLYNEQVQLLYAEMEEQLKAEKEMILRLEKTKEKKARDELGEELQIKDQQLQSLLAKHAEMEKQLEELNSEDSETRHENAKLQKERDTLEQRLAASETMLTDLRGHLHQLRRRSLDEKRRRAQAALRVSEGIALERESLVNELDMLKKVNRQLLDEKDELMLSASNTPLNGSLESSPRSSRQENDLISLLTHKETSEDADLPQTSSHSPSKSSRVPNQANRIPSDTDPLRSVVDDVPENYVLRHQRSDISFDSKENTTTLAIANIDHNFEFGDEAILTSTPHLVHSFISKSDEECEVDDSYFQNNPGLVVANHRGLEFLWKNNLNQSTKKLNNDDLGSAFSVADDSDDNENEKLKEDSEKSPSPTRVLNGSRPLAFHSTKNVSNSSNNSTTYRKRTEGEVTSPERLFKVVFIGDSGVGKSSFIHRFCHDTFRPTFSATIGVDFQVKSLVVDGRLIALQLWDTAGQERFRSLTKQYFRKADGIIIVYDVTSETSFKNVRNWISNVKEGADEHVVIMLIGNKTDLCRRDDDRVVKIKDGNWLADEFGALFFETSAKNGIGVRDSINALSSLLQEKEDEVIERVLQLQDTVKFKKKCC